MTTHTTEQICDPLDYLRPPPTWQDECIQREFKLARVQDKFIDMLIQECKVADAREAFLATGANLVACPALAASNTDNQSGADNEHQDESVEAVSETAIKTDNVGTTEERTSEFFPGLRELVADYVMTTLCASNTDNRSSTTNKHQNKSVKAIPRTAINTDIIRTTEERTSEIFQGVSELVSDYTMPCLDATNTDKQSDPTTVHQDESFEAVSKTAVNTDIAGPAEERTLESFGGVSESVSDHDMDGVDNNQGDLERIIDVLTETASSPLSEAPEDLEDIPLPPKSAKSVAFLVSPRTGRPVTRVKRFVVGEAMDYYLSSSPSVSSTCPEGSVERMEAEASESPLEYHLAKMEGCSHEDALKQIPNGAVPDRRTNYIKIASGTPAEIQAWNNKDKHNTASPSNGSFQASSTSTNAKTQNGQSTEKAASLMVEPSEALRTPDSAAATVDESQKERKAPSPTAEATMATMMTATPTVPTTPMTRSVFAKDAMDSMQEGMGVFSISSRTRKVRDTVRKQKAEEARLAKARREAEGEAKKKAEAEEERKKTGVRRMPTEKVIKPLSAEWERKVDAALAAGDGAQLATTSTGNRLKRKDFGTVLPVAGRDRAGGWLNDEIITGYLQAVVDHGQAMTNSTGRGKTPKYYAFNTFFYSNIRDKGVESVRRWAARGKVGGKALLDVERVFIPVHEHSHWTNIVVGPMARTIEYFDSMGGSPRRYVANVKAWLRQELGPAYVEEEWAVVNSSSPQQQNGLDCGVFAATTAKMIMLGIDPMAYGHEDIPTQRRRMVAELLNGGFHGAFEP